MPPISPARRHKLRYHHKKKKTVRRNRPSSNNLTEITRRAKYKIFFYTVKSKLNNLEKTKNTTNGRTERTANKTPAAKMRTRDGSGPGPQFARIALGHVIKNARELNADQLRVTTNIPLRRLHEARKHRKTPLGDDGRRC